ncbi:MAG: hypothetical protein ACE5I7_07900 [Candidatus Binatia bacterium]
MRYISITLAGLFVSAALFTSCTCHKQVSEPAPSAFKPPPAGFHASGPNITPPMRLAAPKVTPGRKAPPAQVAAAEPASTPPADVPADFPEDVPIYKDAALAQVQNLANDAHNVIFRTAAPITDVYAFYRERMTKAGWKVTQHVQRSTHAFISFKKGDMIANMTFAEDPKNPGKQVIAIMYEQEKPLEFEPF